MSVVLVAEDEEPALEILAEVLTGLGHQVLQALDGEEALLLARAHTPDLVITDYMMPRRTGVELIRAMREHPDLAEIPIVLVSAATPRAASEATAFLPKPLHLDELEEVVTRLLGSNEAPARTPLRTEPATSASFDRVETLNWVAHELKSPLSAARMSAELLRRRLDDIGNAQDRARAGVVIRGLDKMTSLIDAVLDASALGEGRLTLRPVPGDVVQFVARTVELWRGLHPDVRFELELPGHPVMVPLDELRAQQVLDNLLSNAVKYGAEAGLVQVTVKEHPGQVVIQVRDFGPGIPAVDIPHLFERFHRSAEATGKGHGLGLYIAAALARLHGGSLTAKSDFGNGATFLLSLPRVAKPALAAVR